ncbi:profilin, required for normal timing of actin polymerization in response to thermal stress [Coemansia sp. Benny D115]|nr:profilin, required for normal timing of actin polymerization in response to thermal stress [Coemansia sp. Benny D115]
MSWQPYVDNNLVGTGKVLEAAIFGHDGGVWAASKGFQLAPGEFEKIKGGFAADSPLQVNGTYVGGKKYMTNQATGDFILAKARVTEESSNDPTSAVICYKTNQTIIVCTVPKDVQAEEANAVIGKVVDYLVGNNY